MLKKRSIVFMGIPAFPIAVERALSSRLRERPVILVKTDNPRSRCLSVSQEARQYGVVSGMSLHDAKRHCRDISVLLPNPSVYKRAMDAIQKVICEFTPLCEPVRPGQSYLDLTGCNRLFGSTSSATQQIQQEITKKLKLPAEAGIAANKLVSRVAAIDAQISGMVEVEFGGEEPYLAPHRVNVLPSVDRIMRNLLNELNLRFVQEVKAIELEILLAALGPTAFSLSRQSKGIDPSPVLPPYAPPKLIVNEELKEDTNDRDILESVVRKLVLEGVFQLQQSRRSSSMVELKLTYSDGRQSIEIRQFRKPQCESLQLLKDTGELLKRAFNRRVRVRHIELIFHRLSQMAIQLDLWQGKSNLLIEKSITPKIEYDLVQVQKSHSEEFELMKIKKKRALEALSIIQARFGKDSLKLGTVH
ncbi:MAG: hypothetical protein HN590_01045 [Calditrichaeota bacterium]|nr:hypothetical protein [Calditrichota bacterium]